MTGSGSGPTSFSRKRFGSTGQLRVALDGGFRGHSASSTVMPLVNGTYADGSLLTYGGASLRVLESVDLVAETYGSYLIANGASADVKPSNEVVGGIKLFLERNSYLMVGGGARYTNGFEAADQRIFVGFIFEPSIGDRDGDGLQDDVDKCPDDPEDFDGFQDQDGCPDPDNDNDGILDVNDRCPNVPEDPRRRSGRGRLPRRRRRRPRWRRHPGQARQVPGPARGPRRVPGCGRLPGPGQRPGRHPGQARQVPERPRGQGRVRGRRRLPGPGQRP